MTEKMFQNLPLGLYRIFWKDGGSSLAAIGQKASGRRWIAPCNWLEHNLADELDGDAGALRQGRPVWPKIASVESILLHHPEKKPSSHEQLFGFREVKEFAASMEDAYSTFCYRGWGGVIKALRNRGYNDRQIEAIVRSKWTRWAAGTGRANSVTLIRYMDKNNLHAEVDDLVRETFEK